MAKVLVSITIDTECDKSPTWHNSDPLTFDSVLKGVPFKLQPLFKDYDIKPTYFLSPEIIDNPSCVDIFNSIKHECELGTHLHADFIEPMKTSAPLDGFNANAFQTDFSPEIEFKKLENLTQNFNRSFGKNPKVFRAGRYAANKNTIRSLIKLGYKVDSSFTPHLKWEGPTGNIINHELSPEQPYFTNEDDIYAGSKDGPILEVPISILKSRNFFRKKYLWLRPKFSTFREMKKIIRDIIKRYSHLDYVVLIMMFHSLEVIPKASPYTKTEAEVSKYLKLLARTFNFAKENSAHFLTLEEIHSILNKKRT